MDRFEVTLLEDDREERAALHEAFVRGTAVTFGGSPVRVTGAFIRRLPDLTWQFRYQLHRASEAVH